MALGLKLSRSELETHDIMITDLWFDNSSSTNHNTIALGNELKYIKAIYVTVLSGSFLSRNSGGNLTDSYEITNSYIDLISITLKGEVQNQQSVLVRPVVGQTIKQEYRSGQKQLRANSSIYIQTANYIDPKYHLISIHCDIGIDLY